MKLVIKIIKFQLKQQILKQEINIDKQFQYISMFSTAGRIYDRTKKIKPLNKSERLKLYSSLQTKVQRKKGFSKFSPFNTVSRQSRDSYLLRVTNQPNTNTNYQLNYAPTLPLNTRPTIDKAKFKRIIGDVKQQDFQVPHSANTAQRCKKSVSHTLQPKPLTARDCHKWRKTFHHYDFKKQCSYNDQVQKMGSTFHTLNQDMMKKTVQSNFNNYDRFKFQSRTWRAHDFSSDSTHQYLKEIQPKKDLPEYDTSNCKQEIVRMSMHSPKGQPRFYLYRNIIKTRHDRSDPDWNPKLEYSPQTLKKYNTIEIDKTTNRENNQPHSSYPIRLSLSKVLSKKSDVIPTF